MITLKKYTNQRNTGEWIVDDRIDIEEIIKEIDAMTDEEKAAYIEIYDRFK